MYNLVNGTENPKIYVLNKDFNSINNLHVSPTDNTYIIALNTSNSTSSHTEFYKLKIDDIISEKVYHGNRSLQYVSGLISDKYLIVGEMYEKDCGNNPFVNTINLHADKQLAFNPLKDELVNKWPILFEIGDNLAIIDSKTDSACVITGNTKPFQSMMKILTKLVTTNSTNHMIM